MSGRAKYHRTNNRFGRFVRATAERCGFFNQEQLATPLGISSSWMSQIIGGTARPSDKLTAKLAATLNIPEDELLKLRDSQFPAVRKTYSPRDLLDNYDGLTWRFPRAVFVFARPAWTELPPKEIATDRAAQPVWIYYFATFKNRQRVIDSTFAPMRGPRGTVAVFDDRAMLIRDGKCILPRGMVFQLQGRHTVTGTRARLWLVSIEAHKQAKPTPPQPCSRLLTDTPSPTPS
jgi:transcriptional regulator with XRE-family HTH domain